MAFARHVRPARSAQIDVPTWLLSGSVWHFFSVSKWSYPFTRATTLLQYRPGEDLREREERNQMSCEMIRNKLRACYAQKVMGKMANTRRKGGPW